MAEPFIGEIRLFSFNFAPLQWALCDGALLSISQNNALFAILGNAYGGDGISTFALPDLRGRAPIHRSDVFAQASHGGEPTVALTTNQILSHTHTIRASSGSANQPSPQGNTWVTGSGYSKLAPDVKMGGSAIAANQGSQAHENMQPYLVINYCIALVGYFPSRD
jgi:microcystin-dependent protein